MRRLRQRGRHADLYPFLLCSRTSPFLARHHLHLLRCPPQVLPLTNSTLILFLLLFIFHTHICMHALTAHISYSILFYSIPFYSLSLYLLYHHILLSPDQLNHNIYTTTSASCIYFICKINIIILTFQLKAVVLGYACPISLLLLDVL